MKFPRTHGFSLIELMIVVVIVGILAVIALPGYQSHIIKGSRVAAQTELLELASVQEKIYLNSNAYTASVTAAYNGTSAGGLGRTTGLTSDNQYTFTLVAPGQTHTLTATPVAGGRQAGNGCLTLQENGLRQWHENNDACNSASPTPW